MLTTIVSWWQYVLLWDLGTLVHVSLEEIVVVMKTQCCVSWLSIPAKSSPFPEQKGPNVPSWGPPAGWNIGTWITWMLFISTLPFVELLSSREMLRYLSTIHHQLQPISRAMDQINVYFNFLYCFFWLLPSSYIITCLPPSHIQVSAFRR